MSADIRATPGDAQSRVLGPFSLIGEAGAEAKSLVQVSWADVRGAQILVKVADNYDLREPAASFDMTFVPLAEIVFMGQIQGGQFCLKRGQLRGINGFLNYVVDDAEAFDQLAIFGRNMSGGRRGPPGAVAVEPTTANGFVLEVQVLLMPRGGVGPKERFQGMG